MGAGCAERFTSGSARGSRCLCQEDEKSSCCTKDEGRSFGAVLEEEASNCHRLLQSKDRGGERYG
jgi:hypothetical protein